MATTESCGPESKGVIINSTTNQVIGYVVDTTGNRIWKVHPDYMCRSLVITNTTYYYK